MTERVQLPNVPSWLAELPFLFSPRCRSDSDMIVSSALATAAAAMDADPHRRSSRSRIAFLLAELGTRNNRRTGDVSAWIPVTRTELARVANIELTKVKRILGFLLLANVIEVGSNGLRILDWRRLCKLAGYDPNWIAAPLPKEDETSADPALTAAGDQASFV